MALTFYVYSQNVYKFKKGDEIKNIRGTTGRRPADSDSWENYKSKNTGESKRERKCQVRRCTDTNTVGAHVRIKGRGKKDHIVDLCPKHNSAENKDYMNVTAGTKAARVTKEDTEWCF